MILIVSKGFVGYDFEVDIEGRKALQYFQFEAASTYLKFYISENSTTISVLIILKKKDSFSEP